MALLQANHTSEAKRANEIYITPPYQIDPVAWLVTGTLNIM